MGTKSGAQNGAQNVSLVLTAYPYLIQSILDWYTISSAQSGAQSGG